MKENYRNQIEDIICDDADDKDKINDLEDLIDEAVDAVELDDFQESEIAEYLTDLGYFVSQNTNSESAELIGQLDGTIVGGIAIDAVYEYLSKHTEQELTHLLEQNL